MTSRQSTAMVINSRSHEDSFSGSIGSLPSTGYGLGSFEATLRPHRSWSVQRHPVERDLHSLSSRELWLCLEKEGQRTSAAKAAFLREKLVARLKPCP